MLEISVLRVENPSCLWGRIVKGLTEANTSAKYGDLQVKMNLLYNNVNVDVQRTLKLASVEEGQVCVVYWPAMRNWCRAVVESIHLYTEQKHAMCYLVDHGVYVTVKCDEIRTPVEKVLQLPFWVKKFHLSGLHPTTLQVSLDGMKAELIPSSQWDMSATRYFHNLLQASNQTEAVMHETQDDSTAIELYLTIKDVKIYVNDDLVAKKFAYYSRDMVNGNAGNQDFKTPAFLTHDIYCDTKTFLSNNRCPVRPCSPVTPLRNANGKMTVPRPWELMSSVLQQKNPEKKPESCGRPTDPREVLGCTSLKDADTNAADTESDGSEAADTDASLAAALTNNLNIFRLFKFLTGSSRQGAAPNTNLNGELDGSMTQDNSAVNEGETVTGTQHMPAAPCKEDGDAGDGLLDNGGNPVESMMAEWQDARAESLYQRPESPTHSCVSMKSDQSKDDPMSVKSDQSKDDPMSVKSDQSKDDPMSVKSDLSKDDPMSSSIEPGPPHTNIPTRRSEEAFTKPSSEEVYACARLAEWLNPAPLNPPDSEDTDSTDDAVLPSEPSSNDVLVHSVLSVDPCTSLARAPITDIVRRILTRKKYAGPSVSESYCWPAVARGCDTVLVSSTAHDPMNYIPPLLAHVQPANYSTLTHKAGPVAVILCHGWEKAQTVYDLLEESHATQALQPAVIVVGVGKDEGTAAKIPRNCQVLVTTPFSLVRLLACHLRLFLRLCHLVLDEAEMLFSQAPEEMHAILQHFQKVASSEERAYCPRQIVAAGKHWSAGMETLLNQYMSDPCVIITVREEAALYGNVHQMNVLCLESTKITALLGALDFHPDVGQKTLIIGNSAKEVEHVFKAVSKTSAFCLMTHEGLTQQFDFVIQQWRKEIGPGTQVILVTTTDCLRALWVRDATCVVHYGFPTSPKRFGSSLFCMSGNFRNLSDKHVENNNTSSPAKSILLITEMDARHMVGVLRYLKRSDALLPPELLSFAEGVMLAKETQKTDRPLCGYLKSFGVCRDSHVCPERHWFSSTTDQSLLPDSGTITVLPLYIKTASVFYGRIVKNQGDCYESLASKMVSYYATEKLVVKEVVEGGLYGMEEKEVYHRVKVTSVPDQTHCLFFSVRVLFLDEGREQELKSYQLLHLPAQFHGLPPQAVEIIVCRVKPVDKEVDWNPKATRAISQKIRGLQHQARVVLSLGNTIFVDPMVRMTRMAGMKTLINEYNVHAEVLSTGMAASNPEHLLLLRRHRHAAEPPLATGTEVAVENDVQTADAALATVIARAESVSKKNAGSGGPKTPVRSVCPQTGQTSPQAAAAAGSVQVQQREKEEPVDSPRPPEVQPPAAIGPLAEPLHRQAPLAEPLHRQAPLAEPLHRQAPLAEPLHRQAPLKPASAGQTERPDDRHPLEDKPWNDVLASLRNTALRLSNGNKGFSLQNGLSAELIPSEHALPISENQMNACQQLIGADQPNNAASTESFHPQIKWHQRKELVIVKVKLSNPVSQKCEFYSDRVVYSGMVGDRPYRADLELQDGIVAERCSWALKANEPVLTLVKQRKGRWDKLVKHKNNCVRYDFDYYEDMEEENTPKSGRFVETMVDDDDDADEGRRVDSSSDSELD